MPVFSPRRTEEGVEAVLDALDDGLVVLELTGGEPAGDLLHELRLQVGVVADEETLDAQPLVWISRERLLGPGAGSVLLYWAIMPQIAARPCRLSDEIAASRWSPPTLSK